MTAVRLSVSADTRDFERNMADLIEAGERFGNTGPPAPLVVPPLSPIIAKVPSMNHLMGALALLVGGPPTMLLSMILFLDAGLDVQLHPAYVVALFTGALGLVYLILQRTATKWLGIAEGWDQMVKDVAATKTALEEIKGSILRQHEKENTNATNIAVLFDRDERRPK